MIMPLYDILRPDSKGSVGAIAGMLASLGLTHVLGSLLFGVDPIDAITLLGVGAMLVAAASLASSIPAHKATWVDPMVTMRSAELWRNRTNGVCCGRKLWSAHTQQARLRRKETGRNGALPSKGTSDFVGRRLLYVNILDSRRWSRQFAHGEEPRPP